MLHVFRRATIVACLVAMTADVFPQTTQPLSALTELSGNAINADWSPSAKPMAIPTHLSQLIALQATESSRTAFRKRWDEKTQEAFTTVPLAEKADTWSTALWASTVFPVTDLQREGVRKALQAYGKLPDEFCRESMEAAYGVDPHAFLVEMLRISEETTSPKHFGMAALYVVRAMPDARREMFSRMERRFPNWAEDPILIMLFHQALQPGEPTISADTLTTKPETSGMQATQRPPLVPILSRNFAPGFPVIYTLQRKDRSYPGIAVIRRPDGTFLRQPNGQVFSVAQLARSRTNLPGYITNGNTPQGVFSIQGFGRSKSRDIGQTPYIHTFIPYELTPEQYFHTADAATTGTSWTLARYREMLPDAQTTEAATGQAAPAWRDYLSMYTGYYASKAGRGDMLSHGTTVDVNFYPGASWYPHTPTSGCMCAKEIWDRATGRALMSDQLALVLAYLEAAGYTIPRNDPNAVITVPKGPAGYVVVIELNDKTQPVSLDEVLVDLLTAEKG